MNIYNDFKNFSIDELKGLFDRYFTGMLNIERDILPDDEVVISIFFSNSESLYLWFYPNDITESYSEVNDLEEKGLKVLKLIMRKYKLDKLKLHIMQTRNNS